MATQGTLCIHKYLNILRKQTVYFYIYIIFYKKKVRMKHSKSMISNIWRSPFPNSDTYKSGHLLDFPGRMPREFYIMHVILFL